MAHARRQGRTSLHSREKSWASRGSLAFSRVSAVVQPPRLYSASNEPLRGAAPRAPPPAGTEFRPAARQVSAADGRAARGAQADARAARGRAEEDAAQQRLPRRRGAEEARGIE